MTTADQFKFLTPGDAPEAAVLLMFNTMGQVLAIQRTDTGKLGLPGGKREGDETIKDCAIREMMEETGVQITKIMPCFARKGATFFTTTFFVQEAKLPPAGIKPKTPEGTPVWVEMWQLCDPEKCTFAEYNSHLLRSVLAHFSAAGV